MTNAFHKFPRTPHLVWLGAKAPRADKVMSAGEAVQFLAGKIIVEEKVDGSNLGLSVDADGRLRAQSRGSYLRPGHSHAQWQPLWAWLDQRKSEIIEGLRGGLMLFGEWCYARHSIGYSALPDWFLGFDIFDPASGDFWSVERRNEWLADRHLCGVPEVARGRFQLNQASGMLGASELGDVLAEGIYLRRDSGEKLQARAKVVSPMFLQQIEEHWSRRPVTPNYLAKSDATEQKCAVRLAASDGSFGDSILRQ